MELRFIKIEKRLEDLEVLQLHDINETNEQSNNTNHQSPLTELEVFNIEIKNSKEIIEDYICDFTNHSERELYSEQEEQEILNIEDGKTSSINSSENYEINNEEEGETSDVKPKISKPFGRNYKLKPQFTQRWNYNRDSLNKKLWQKRLYANHEQTTPEILDLDCPTDMEKAIQSWSGKISAKIIENKIGIIDSYRYILGTIIGSVRTYIQNLTNEEQELLKSNTDLEGKTITTAQDMLRKFEIMRVWRFKCRWEGWIVIKKVSWACYEQSIAVMERKEKGGGRLMNNKSIYLLLIFFSVFILILRKQSNFNTNQC